MNRAPTTQWRLVLVAAVVASLLLSVAAAARSGKDYVLEEGTSAGGNYHLTRVTVPTDNALSGGGYQLLSLARSTTQGAGCCCTYLPCIQRKR